MEFIGEDLNGDLSLLGEYEIYYGEGDRGELKLYLDQPVPTPMLERLEDEILTHEVYLTKPIRQKDRTITVSFEKRIGPLAIIAGAAILIIGGVVAWQVWRGGEMGVPPWVFIIAGGALIFLLVSD